jgi:predicted DNA-binding transcriptional regulator YafY
VANQDGNAAVERMLRLAAYFKLRRGQQVTLADICANVPGYDANFRSDGLLVKDAAWEAVRKKVRRDLSLLSDVFGIRVEYDDQTQVYKLLAPFLSAEERDVLVAAAALVRVDGIDDEQLTALGAAVDSEGQRIVVRVHRHLLALRAALSARSPVRFRYRDTERVFEPWAVGLWRDRWYAVGNDRGAGEQRVYRLDRIEDDGTRPVIEVVPEPGSYEIPEGFDADDALVLDPNNWGHDPPVRACVRIETDWAQHFGRELGGEIVERGDGFVEVALTVRHYESFRDRLLGFGTHAVLLEPATLVAELRAWLVGMAS